MVREHEVVEVGEVTLELIGLDDLIKRNVRVLALDIAEGERIRAAAVAYAHVHRAVILTALRLVGDDYARAECLQQLGKRRAVGVFGGGSPAVNLSDSAQVVGDGGHEQTPPP